MNKTGKPTKSYKQLVSEVDSAIKEQKGKILSDQIRFQFDILSSKYGWTRADFDAVYPEQTIAQAIRQGWKGCKS